MKSFPVPPLSPYGTFTGQLFQYKSFPALAAFESSPSKELSANKCILIGGLSDSLIPTPYAKQLEQKLHGLGWSLVQPLLSSSGLGFGHGNLERDTEELSHLMNYLKYHRSAKNFALVGHSTGCQNSVHYIKYGDEELIEQIKVIGLQAPVSDREGAMSGPNYKENIEHAKGLQEQGKEDEMMPRSAFWAPITAARFLSLQEFGGEDDFFSSDYTDEEMSIRLQHVGQRGSSTGLKVLVCFSGEDEYVPDGIDKKDLLKRLCGAMNGVHEKVNESEVAMSLYLEEGNHNLSESDGDKDRFVDDLGELLKGIF